MEATLSITNCSITYLEQLGLVLGAQLAVRELNDNKLVNKTRSPDPCKWFEENLLLIPCPKKASPEVLEYIALYNASRCPLDKEDLICC